MIGGLFTSASRLAIVAAAGLMIGSVTAPAQAADLGGDCCADLEERVAELEATTVRKGNRNISVTLYGQVNQAVLWYDNGEESDAYVVDADELSGSRFGIRGSASMKPGWTAGFRLEIATVAAASSGVSENDNDDGDYFLIRQSTVYVESEQMGRLTIGQQSQATDGITEINLGGSYTGYHSGSIWTSSFQLYDATAGYLGVTWSSVQSSLDGSRRNLVRYDSPTFAGFTMSAAWGEDDVWDVALRFAQEWNGLRVAAGIGYLDNQDEGADAQTISGSASVWHVPSGIFVAGAYAERDLNVIGRDDVVSWSGSAGIRKRMTEMGATTVSFTYGVTDALFANNTDATYWNIGLDQDIDSVGATAYLAYRHHEADATAQGVSVEDMDTVIAGMVVRF
jgi:predicted porin